MSFAVGSLVTAQAEKWVVLPETDDELVMVRPLGGTDAEITGILTSLESVEPAPFAPPDPAKPVITGHCTIAAWRASAWLSFERRPVSFGWSPCGRTSSVPARTASYGVAARRCPAAHCRRRWYWQDGRVLADRS